MTLALTHHPSCGYWLENCADDCACGLGADRPGWSRLEPWSVAAMEALRRQHRIGHHAPAGRVWLPREPSDSLVLPAYGDQCADTDGLAAARDPMRADGEVGL